jgi:hypothetical protein
MGPPFSIIQICPAPTRFSSLQLGFPADGYGVQSSLSLGCCVLVGCGGQADWI